MKLVDNPILFPACCVVCSGTDGPLVDTLTENIVGRVYLCRHCTLKLAAAVEFVPLAEQVTLTAELRATQAQVVEAEQQAKAAAKTEHELRQRVATLQDDVATARTHYAVLEKVNAELKTDPAVMARQQLIEQLAAVNAKPERQKTAARAVRQ